MSEKILDDKKKYKADMGTKHTVKTASAMDWFVVVGSILADATCFAMLLYFLSWHWAAAAGLGLLIAFIVDGGAYYFADVGLGNFLAFPKVWKIKDISYDLRRAIGVMIGAGLVVTIALVSFSYLRWEQIKSEDMRLEKFESYRQTTEYQAFSRDEQIDWDRRNRPRYFSPNNRTFDMITLIVPILTTLFSLAAGVFKDRRYERYDKQINELNEKIQTERDGYNSQIEAVKSKYLPLIELEDKEFSEKKNNFIKEKERILAEKHDAIERLKNEIGGAISIRENANTEDMNSIIEYISNENIDVLKVFAERKTNTKAYQDLVKKVSTYAKDNAKNYYNKHVNLIVSDFEKVCSQILSIVREWADNKNIIANQTIDNAVNGYRDGVTDPTIVQIAKAYLRLADKKIDDSIEDTFIDDFFTDSNKKNGENNET